MATLCWRVDSNSPLSLNRRHYTPFHFQPALIPSKIRFSSIFSEKLTTVIQKSSTLSNYISESNHTTQLPHTKFSSTKQSAQQKLRIHPSIPKSQPPQVAVYFSFLPMTSCMICLEPPSPEMGKVDCDHSFCLNCIHKWTAECSACPICRTEITKIRLFYRSFFMGDETNVVKKQQEMPIPDDPLSQPDSDSDDFIDEEIIYESQPSEVFIDQHSGTGWHSGHRVSLRARAVQKNEGFRQFRSDLLKERQKEMNQTIQTVARMTQSKKITESEGGEYFHSRFGSRESQPSRMRPLRANVLMFDSYFELE
jgi:hypothetical protein